MLCFLLHPRETNVSLLSVWHSKQDDACVGGDSVSTMSYTGALMTKQPCLLRSTENRMMLMWLGEAAGIYHNGVLTKRRIFFGI